MKDLDDAFKLLHTTRAGNSENSYQAKISVPNLTSSENAIGSKCDILICIYRIKIVQSCSAKV